MDEDCDVDVESAEEVPDIGGEATASTYDEGFHDSEDGGVKNDKREHHNLLERRRRDHIKESFYGLRDCIPQLSGEKVSRAHILNKATEYIRDMQKNGSNRENEIVGLRLRNEILEQQIKALERHKAAGNGQNAEDILEAVQEEITAKHKEEQQKQTKKINSLVSERNDGDGRSLPGVKTRASANATKKTHSSGPALPTKSTTATVNSDPATPLSNAAPAISLLASNLKNTQTLLTALQKSLPPNANLPANIKSLAQRVLASPGIARSQLQATASSALRGIVTATTVTSKPTPSPSTPQTQQKVPPDSETTPSTQPPTILAKSTVKPNTAKPVQVKVEPLNDTGDIKLPKSTTPPPKTIQETAKTTTLVSALTTPAPVTSQAQTQQPSLSPQQILRTAHLLLQQQGSALNTNVVSSEKQNMSTLTPEVLAQVSSYLNLPGTFSTETVGVQAEIMPIGDEGVTVPNSFLTAALTGGVAVEEEVTQQLVTEVQGTEGLPHTTAQPVKRAATCSEDEVEQTVKKPRVVL